MTSSIVDSGFVPRGPLSNSYPLWYIKSLVICFSEGQKRGASLVQVNKLESVREIISRRNLAQDSSKGTLRRAQNQTESFKMERYNYLSASGLPSGFKTVR